MCLLVAASRWLGGEGVGSFLGGGSLVSGPRAGAHGASEGLAARHLNRPSSLQFEEAFGSTWLRYALLSQ